MSNHTNAPWHPSTNGSSFFYDADGKVVGAVEHLRDIHVVSAAPEMLEALKGMLRATDFDQDEPWVVAANAAIAKAEVQP